MHAATISAFDSSPPFKVFASNTSYSNKKTLYKTSFKMLIADVFLRYRKRFQVAVFALLLFTPIRSLETPNGCAEVVSALAKNSSMDVLVKEPNFLPNAVKCLHEITKLIGETDWTSVQAMMPPKITKFIHNVGLHIMGNAEAYATGAGLVFMSVYLCYKGAELSAEAKHLALEHEKFQEEFDLLEQELIQIRSFITTDIVRQWKTGNTVQLVKNIKKLIEKLDRSFTILKELANQIRHNAKKCESGKAWSVFYGVLATGFCASAIFTGISVVYTTVCGVSIGTICLSCDIYTMNHKTLEKSTRLQQDARDWRMEIAKYRVNFDIVKMKLDMRPTLGP